MHEHIINHPRNLSIKFDKDKHKYWYADNPLEFNKEFKGVTSLIGDYKNPFERDRMSKYVAMRDGITQQEVLDMWNETRDTAIEYGNLIHDSIELMDETGELNPECETELANYAKECSLYNLESVISEWVVYDEDIERASAIDKLFYRKDDKKYVIADFKTPEKGIQYSGYKDQRMLYPLRNLPDSSYWHYSLQLSVYRRWLKEKYYVDVAEDSYLIYIRDNVCEFILAANLDDEIHALYKTLL